MSMLGIAFLNELANTSQKLSAAEVLEALREQVKRALHQDISRGSSRDGMDMALCVVDHQNHIVQYAGANNPLVYFNSQGLQQIKATRSPIAVYPKERPFEQHAIQAQPGDSFYIFSDGMLDQFDHSMTQRYGIRQLKEKLQAIYQLPMQAQYEHLTESLEKWQGQTKQIDDILLIGFRL